MIGEEGEDEGIELIPFKLFFDREGTTVRVECVSMLSVDELEDSDGDGEAVLDERLLCVSMGGGLGIIRADSISTLRSSSSLDIRHCIKAVDYWIHLRRGDGTHTSFVSPLSSLSYVKNSFA